MNRDEVFATTAARRSDFEFNEAVAAVFDDMLLRSVPFYTEQQALIAEVARQFYVPATVACDLGCSIGTTLMRLAKALGPDAKLIGFDKSQPMLDKARENITHAGLAQQVELHCLDFNAGVAQFALANVSVVTLCWTLQFVRPLERDALIRWIYDALVPGGVLVVTEKVLTNSSEMNRYFIEFYYDFKRRNGYSENEIHKKREALENVLIPYRLDENLELLRRNGFPIVETFFQWYNFAGLLAVKR